MTYHDNPREPEPAYLRSDQRINDMAELLNMRRERIDTLVAELATTQERIAALEAENTKLRVERDHWCSQGIGTALAEANARIRALEAENTKLQGQLDALVQRRDPPGSYLIRSPGVYLAYMDDRGELHVVRREVKDSVIANVDIHAGWNYVGRDTHGEPYMLAPDQQAQEAIGRVVRTDGVTVQVKVDPSLRTEFNTQKGEPQIDTSITERLTRLEEQAEMMAPRLARMEAWARQFPRTMVQHYPFKQSPQTVVLPNRPVERLDDMKPEPKE